MPALLLTATVLLSTLSISVNAHSWVECTNYVNPTGGQLEDYDASICKGFPRCAARQISAGFGQDTGLNVNKQECQCPLGSTQNAISDDQIATYTPGQRVCLAYPPKNHVAATCNNVFIPDNGVIIKRSAVNPTSDSFSTTYDHLNGVHENGKEDYKGFQNCPKFCEDNDKALCTMCFDLEDDIAEGTYSFSWEWEFNPGSYYTTCWDAKVGSGGAGRVPDPAPAPADPAPAPANQEPANPAPANPTPAPADPAPAPANPAPAPAPAGNNAALKDLLEQMSKLINQGLQALNEGGAGLAGAGNNAALKDLLEQMSKLINQGLQALNEGARKLRA